MSITSEKNGIAYNNNLKTIIFPDNTSFQTITEINDTIEEEYHNKSVETIILPNKNVAISYRAFSHFDNLKILYIPPEISDFSNSRIILDCPNVVIYCHPNSAAEEYAKNCGYKYKLVNTAKIDNGYLIFPTEVPLGGIKHISLEVIGDTDLLSKNISWSSDDETISIKSFAHTDSVVEVSFIPQELGTHSINCYIDNNTYKFTFDVVKEKATGFIGEYVSTKANKDGVFLPSINKNDNQYAQELKNWIEKLGYQEYFEDYLSKHTYEDMLDIEIAMPIKDSSGNDYLWTNTSITVRDMMTYIIFMNSNKDYLKTMEKEISDTNQYAYQGRIYSLKYQDAYEYLMNLYIANCELERSLTGNEEMLKYLQTLTYGIVFVSNLDINKEPFKDMQKGYNYLKKFDKLQIDDVTDTENDIWGYVISGGNVNELSYDVQKDITELKKKLDDGVIMAKGIKKIIKLGLSENVETEYEDVMVSLVWDSFLPLCYNHFDDKYVSKTYKDIVNGVKEFIDVGKATIPAMLNVFQNPSGFLIAMPAKLSEKYISEVRGIFDEAEKMDMGWCALTLYTFLDDMDKLSAYYNLNELKINSILESNLNFSYNTKIEKGIADDYESKYSYGDGSFATFPSDYKMLVLIKAASLANQIKNEDTEYKAEELLQHISAQLNQDIDDFNHSHTFSSEWSHDEDYHWHSATCIHSSEIADKTTHSGGMATCAEKAKCDVCNAEYGDFEKHVYGEWILNETSHWKTCSGCGGTTAPENHCGGTASSTQKAICTVCGEEYGSLAAHTEVTDFAKAATCTSTGISEGKHCSACGEVLIPQTVIPVLNHTEDSGTVTKMPTSSETGERTFKCVSCGTVLRTEIIPVISEEHIHTYGNEWKYDGASHWRECECGETVDTASHTGTASCTVKAVCTVCGLEYGDLLPHISDSGAVTKEPTSTETGIKTFKCVNCGTVMRTEVLPVISEEHIHNIVADEAIPATCIAAGKTAGTHCSLCGEVLTAQMVIPAAGHTGGTASCTVKAICTVCGEEYGDLISHTSDSGTVTKEPTSTETGEKIFKCTVCGTVIRTETIPSTGADVNIPSYPSAPSRPSNPVQPTTPAANKEPYIEGDNSRTGWTAISEKISNTADGGTVAVNMNGTTEIPKNILSEISGRNIDLVLEIDGFIWTINGTSVKNAKNVDMGVKKNSGKIPNSAIRDFTGSSTITLSLAHNGDFGFAATLTINLGSENDGRFANLYCYDTKNKSFDFSNCSEIKNGRASLVFVHASEWLISIDDFPVYEEDVSSGACVKADDTLIADKEEKRAKFTVMPIFVLTASIYIFRRKARK
ncbi:MAG: leucine-rich repeat domain-containing protein [Ruminococcus sp.]|nr:leucine-rich repeat domain-containing protein [Ruminococcus sp.]